MTYLEQLQTQEGKFCVVQVLNEQEKKLCIEYSVDWNRPASITQALVHCIQQDFPELFGALLDRAVQTTVLISSPNIGALGPKNLRYYNLRYFLKVLREKVGLKFLIDYLDRRQFLEERVLEQSFESFILKLKTNNYQVRISEEANSTILVEI